MMTANVFNNGFFGDFFDDVMRDFGPRPGRSEAAAPKPYLQMRTDVKEKEDAFELAVELPGYKKDEVSAELKDGYLIIQAQKNEEKDEKADDGRYIRRERYTGRMSRRFFVGKKLKEEDVQAGFQDGVLTVTVPKETKLDRPEEKKLIPIL